MVFVWFGRPAFAGIRGDWDGRRERESSQSKWHDCRYVLYGERYGVCDWWQT